MRGRWFALALAVLVAAVFPFAGLIFPLFCAGLVFLVGGVFPKARGGLLFCLALWFAFVAQGAMMQSN
jgi:hypothetical protein